MSAEFEKMRQKIKSSLKKQYPKMKDDEIEKKSWAVATAQWKKSHGGKAPEGVENIKLKEDWKMLEFMAPITEKIFESEDFIIKGTAINETTTRNNHKYIAEELEKSAPQLMGKKLLLNHDNRVESIVGIVKNSFWDPLSRAIKFEGKVMDKNIQSMIMDGRLTDVSIGAYAHDLIEEEGTGALIAKGMDIVELSFVAVPADSRATFDMAMANAYDMKETFKLIEHMNTCDDGDCGKEDGINKKDNTSSEDNLKCPYCDKKFNSHDHLNQHVGDTHPDKHSDYAKHNKNDLHTQKLERRFGEMTEETQTQSITESAEYKKLSEELAVMKKEKREALIEQYKTICSEKKLNAKDVSNLTEETIKVLIEQIKEIKVEEKREMKSLVSKEDNAVSEKFMVERTSKGYAMFPMPDSKGRIAVNK